MYKAIAFSLPVPPPPESGGAGAEGGPSEVRAKGPSRAGRTAVSASLAAVGAGQGQQGHPSPRAHTHTHTHTHTHAHPGFQRSPISVNIPTVVETERPTWRQWSAAPLRGRRLAGSGRPGLAPAPEAWACAEGAHLPPSQRGQEGPGGVFSGEAAWPRLSPTPPWSAQGDGAQEPLCATSLSLGPGAGATNAAS